MDGSSAEQYSFEVGCVRVCRMVGERRKDVEVISINTPKETLQIYVSRTGSVRILSLDEEWFKNGIRSLS